MGPADKVDKQTMERVEEALVSLLNHEPEPQPKTKTQAEEQAFSHGYARGWEERDS